MTSVIDLFAGPGGIDSALAAHGFDPLGVEWDDAACATRTAVGLRTLQADVSRLDPLDFAPVVGLAGGPPCPAFSMAGKGAGRDAIGFYADAIRRMAQGEQIDQAELDRACGDGRAHLVLEPLRWALALRPRWVMLEQVPPALPLWEATATALRAEGYATWTGLLSAEQYGVPQTRKRAFLIASLDGPVSMPKPTHQRYISPRSRDDEGGGMFDLPDAGRVVAPEDAGLSPWVSMAEALGWQEGPSPSPSPSVTGGGGATGGVEVFASKAARRRALGAVGFQVPYGEGMIERHGDRTPRPATEPAPAITGKARSAERKLVPTHYDRRQQTNGAPVPLIGVDRPAPTIAAQGLAKGRDVWVTERPATTVNGDPRISEPGHHDAEVSGSQQVNAVRVSLAEALILQSFPPDYPVQGTKTKQFEQVGNAVPPLLAWHVVGAVIAAADARQEQAA